jgi:hypothetical protein
MASGFLQADVSTTVNLGATQSGSAASTYSNDFAKITLTTHTATGTSIGLPTGGVKWSHFELIIVDSGQANEIDRACKVFFTWDTNGDDIAAGPSSSAPMVAGRADTDSYMVVIDMDMVPSLPPDGAADTVYAWVATKNLTDHTGAQLLRARLYWHDLTKG